METLLESDRPEAIYSRLLRQEVILSRIMSELERIQLKLSSSQDSGAQTIRDRKLRLLRIILESKEAANISQLAKAARADEKTVRSDLNLLANEGLILYMIGRRKSNPGRRGNRPRLTREGRRTAEAAFELDCEETGMPWSHAQSRGLTDQRSV